jgi:hypothetical protein
MHAADYSGVLVSADRGTTWKPRGEISHPGVAPEVDRLIEGAIVPLGKYAHECEGMGGNNQRKKEQVLPCMHTCIS